MKQNQYNVLVDAEAKTYEFVSDGIKGSIVKLVQYSPMYGSNDFYNLGFGDKDLATGGFNDMVISNNGDTQKVIVTVASTVLDFTDRYPDVWVFATGSTPARTRLYQIGITTNLELITSNFEVFGLTKDGWKDFEIGTNFEAFLIKRKKQ